MRFATSPNIEGDLNIDERIVADMITASRVLAAKLDELPELP
jgi:hypothetical protein